MYYTYIYIYIHICLKAGGFYRRCSALDLLLLRFCGRGFFIARSQWRPHEVQAVARLAQGPLGSIRRGRRHKHVVPASLGSQRYT